MVHKRITVQELIMELENYNPNAVVTMMAYGAIHPFNIVYGHSLGEAQDGLVNPKNCDNISFYLEDLNTQENLQENGGVG